MPEPLSSSSSLATSSVLNLKLEPVFWVDPNAPAEDPVDANGLTTGTPAGFAAAANGLTLGTILSDLSPNSDPLAGLAGFVGRLGVSAKTGSSGGGVESLGIMGAAGEGEAAAILFTVFIVVWLVEKEVQALLQGVYRGGQL